MTIIIKGFRTLQRYPRTLLLYLIFKSFMISSCSSHLYLRSVRVEAIIFNMMFLPIYDFMRPFFKFCRRQNLSISLLPSYFKIFAAYINEMINSRVIPLFKHFQILN